ncbi:MAG: glycosyltransferase family 9 protein [Planctomycetes bacterium]|nr:glycosyltransferase family 9 protein [Planctomycetota bacterium]
MHELLIVKTAALGDVLRTTSILEGLCERHGPARVTWLTAPGAVDLLRTHPLVSTVLAVDVKSAASVEEAARRLAETRWSRVIALDDEEPLCGIVARLSTESLSGATLDASGKRVYTDDVAPWFDMGLLSRFGKAEADRLKVLNTRSQPALYAAMLGIRMGKPGLVLPAAARAFGAAFRARHALDERRPLVGLNTGAGGRWLSKQLSEERTVELCGALAQALHGRVTFVLLGGEAEQERNRRIREGLARWPAPLAFVDAGTDNALLDFAAIVAGLDLLVTSDSLALHMAVAEDVPVVVFFAPTSAAEIELYGRGEKVVSTAPDYCSYKPDADNTSLTTPRLLAACLRRLEAAPASR